MPPPQIEIVTVTYGNMLPVLKRTVESLYKFREDPFRLIVVNNGSTDRTARYCAGLTDCELVDLPENIGVVKAYNIGLRKSNAPFIARMDQDVEFVMPWQSGLLRLLKAADDVGFLTENGLFDEEFPCASFEDIELGYRLKTVDLKLFFDRKAVA